MALTQENIKAINEFIRRWNEGERGFMPFHEATERLFARSLRECGISLAKRPTGWRKGDPKAAAHFEKMRAARSEYYQEFKEWRRQRASAE